MKHREPRTFSEIVAYSMGDVKRITFRRYGLRGEHKRAMWHRFPVTDPEAVSPRELMIENVTQTNTLFKYLTRKT